MQHYVKNLSNSEKKIYLVAYRLKRDGISCAPKIVARILNIDEKDVENAIKKFNGIL